MSEAKIALRDQMFTARNAMAPAQLTDASAAIAEHLLATEEVRRAASVAAYVSVGREPGTGLFLDALMQAGKRVLLPVLMPDNDLDWAAYTGELTRAGRGLLEPVGPRLGPEAIATPEVVLVPGLAVGLDGMRIGRGGGSYDRALARVPTSTFTCVALHDHEVVVGVPSEPHDLPVRAAVTPAGLQRF